MLQASTAAAHKRPKTTAPDVQQQLQRELEELKQQLAAERTKASQAEAELADCKEALAQRRKEQREQRAVVQHTHLVGPVNTSGT